MTTPSAPPPGRRIVVVSPCRDEARYMQDVARQATRLQSGYVYHYAFAMLIGVVLLVTWYLFGSGW